MFTVVLWSQWKWSRIVIVLGTIAGFTLPILSLQSARAADPDSSTASLLRGVQAWGTLYPVIAATLGLLVAIATWAPDHRGRHIHALTLPIARWRFVLLRFGAGASLLCVPVVAVLIGSLIATTSISIPTGLHGYPVALSMRFGLAVFVAFSIFFAVSGATARTAAIILGLFASVIVVAIIAGVAGIDFALPQRLQTVFLDWPGPLAIFTGRWMIIDV
jgi:hypothetical protein